MSDQFNRDLAEQEERRAFRPSGRESIVRAPSFTFGDVAAFVLILAMVWGPLAIGALRA